jgi:signal transduction histidine kinase
MHYDDRLATVLRVRADGEALVRIQYRQLLDLLGTKPVERQGEQIESAYDRLAALSRRISPGERAAMLEDAGLRLRSPRLVAALTSAEPQVASAAVRRAELTSEDWLDLIPALPIAARGMVRHRRDLGPVVETLLERLGIGDRGLPMAENIVIEPADAVIEGPPGGIGAIVRRIEAYRKAREAPVAANMNESPRLPLGEEHVLHAPARVECFDFATAADGRIVWADPGVAPMVVGFLPFKRESLGIKSDALRQRQPLRNMAVAISGGAAIAGDWQLDAAPMFDPGTSGFTGFAGRMRRTPAPATRKSVDSPREREADRIRQLLHELRTPVSAIQGFAEVIQQQLFGPAPHEYRALAASIAGDAARVLAAFEELERFAKLESAALDIETGECDLAKLVAEAVQRLTPYTSQRKSGFAVAAPDHLPAAIALIEAERIVWRLLATIAGTAAPGEVLSLTLAHDGIGVRLTAQLPGVLALRDDKALFGAAVGAVPQTIASGVFGIGFALRLAISEAKAAGGSLERDGNFLSLWLPGLTG